MSTPRLDPYAARPGFSRRVVLSLPALAVAGGLAACDRDEPPIVPADDPSASPTPTQIAAEALTTGETLNVTVGPLVRFTHQGSDLTVLPLSVARPADAAAPTLDAAAVVLGGLVSTVGVYKPLRLIDTEGSRIWSTTTLQALVEPIGPGEASAKDRKSVV